jgi:hypothetical protein
LLTSTDWNTFNGKQSVGAAHFVGTTSIANNRASGAQTLTGVSIDGNAVDWGGVTFNGVSSSSGIDYFFGYKSSLDTGHLLTLADTKTALGLSSAVTGTGTSGYLTKWTGTSTQGNSMVYDNGTNVGIHTTNPGVDLDVRGISWVGTTDLVVGTTGSLVQIDQGAATGNTYTRIRSYKNGGTIAAPLALQENGGAVLINTGTDNGKKLQVSGEGKFTVGNVEGLTVESANSGFIEVGKTSGSRWRWTNDNFAAGSFELLYGASGATPTTQRLFMDSSGAIRINNLSGTGTRTVVADASGNLSAAALNNADQISLSAVSGNADYAVIMSGLTGSYNLLNYAALTFNPSTKRLIPSGPIKLKNYTVATLPTGQQGDTAYVTDALTPAFLVTVVGGGSVITPVFYNGTNWVAH